MPVGFSLDGIANTFSWHDWDVVGSNGIRRHTLGGDVDFPRQYDAWAYRTHGDWTPRTSMEVNQLQFFRGEDLVPVYSCFGGLAVYSMPAYLAGEYHGSGSQHVALDRP